MCVECGCESAEASQISTAVAEQTPAVHTADEYVAVATLEQVSEGCPLGVRVDGVPVVLGRVGNQVYAIGGVCSHRQGRLEEGSLADGLVTCPLHGAMFDLRTGDALHRPAVQAVPAYDVQIEGETVLVARRPIGR